MVVAVLAGSAAGCAGGTAPAPPRPTAAAPTSAARAAEPTAPGTATGTATGTVTGVAPGAAPRPALAARGAAADAYAAGRPGVTGIVVRDRQTGEVWRNASAGAHFRAASTVKLAIAVDLLTRARTGEIQLGPVDEIALQNMIISSDNAATDRLWARFGGPEIGARFSAYGLTGATGITAWGTLRCSPDDLERLVSYVLERTDPADRTTLVGLLRGVTAKQRWGVLGLAAAARPGAKNGWTPSPGGWAVDTAGFAGPAERYTVVVMTDLSGTSGDLAAGVRTVTGTVTTLFLGLL